MGRIWEELLTEADKLVIERGGYGKSRGLGKKPLLLIIDPQYNYMGENVPIEEQLHKYPSGGGQAAWATVDNVKELKALADELDIPTIYTRNVQKKSIQFDSFALKANRDNSNYVDGMPGTMIIEELLPTEKDIVVDKCYASAFFGTPLISYLVKLGVDSLIVVGGSTSGCVRATIVDAVTHNFNVAIIEDAVYDRIELSHKAALLDLWMKYCDVLSTEDIKDYLVSLRTTA